MLLFLLPLNDYLARLSQPRAIADIVLVFLGVYGVLKLVRGTRAAPMAAGIGAFALLYWLAIYQGLATLEFILRGALLYIGVAIIVLFQSEIRQALIRFGNRFRLPFARRHRGQFGESIYDEIVLAATTLASTKTGALIVIQRNVGLNGIVAASCFLPLSLNPQLSKDLGTGHRAALGVTEDSDAVAIVVSEETGLISFVRAGRIKRALDPTRLRAAIFQTIEGHEAPAAARVNESERETEEIASA